MHSVEAVAGLIVQIIVDHAALTDTDRSRAFEAATPDGGLAASVLRLRSI